MRLKITRQNTTFNAYVQFDRQAIGALKGLGVLF